MQHLPHLKIEMHNSCTGFFSDSHRKIRALVQLPLTAPPRTLTALGQVLAPDWPTGRTSDLCSALCLWGWVGPPGFGLGVHIDQYSQQIVLIVPLSKQWCNHNTVLFYVFLDLFPFSVFFTVFLSKVTK
jgi:hypothetical protein